MKLKSNNPSGVLTNGDLDKIAELMDERVAPLATKAELNLAVAKLATKEELKNFETSLKTHINQGIESVIGGMDALHDELTGKKSRPWLTRE